MATTLQYTDLDPRRIQVGAGYKDFIFFADQYQKLGPEEFLRKYGNKQNLKKVIKLNLEEDKKWIESEKKKEEENEKAKAQRQQVGNGIITDLLKKWMKKAYGLELLERKPVGLFPTKGQGRKTGRGHKRAR